MSICLSLSVCLCPCPSVCLSLQFTEAIKGHFLSGIVDQQKASSSHLNIVIYNEGFGHMISTCNQKVCFVGGFFYMPFSLMLLFLDIYSSWCFETPMLQLSDPLWAETTKQPTASPAVKRGHPPPHPIFHQEF